MTRKFQRRIEDFVCEHCGAPVTGNGYTNHCPHCLWSKHVDVNPGDRAAECGGLMRPIAVTRKGDHWVIVQRCERCGVVRQCKSAPEDDFEVLVEVAKAVALGE